MKKIKVKNIIIKITTLVILLTPLFVVGIDLPNPLKYNEFKDLVDAFINFIFWVGISLAPVMVLIAAFNFMTAGGDPYKVDIAKKILLYTAIGLAVVLMAKGLIGVLKNILGVQLPNSP